MGSLPTNGSPNNPDYNILRNGEVIRFLLGTSRRKFIQHSHDEKSSSFSTNMKAQHTKKIPLVTHIDCPTWNWIIYKVSHCKIFEVVSNFCCFTMFHPFTGFQHVLHKKKQVIPRKVPDYSHKTSSGLLDTSSPHLVLPFPAAPLASQWRRRRPRATTGVVHWIIPQ